MSDGEQGLLRPGWGRPELVLALSACVEEWQRLLGPPALGPEGSFFALVQRSRQLEGPCRGSGFGGVAHHLVALSQMARAAAPTPPLREQLGVVRDLLASARGSLTPEELARAQQPAPQPAGAGMMTPPPLLSGVFTPGPHGSPPPPTSMQPPRMLTSYGQKSPPTAAPPPGVLAPGFAPPAADQRPLPVSPAAPAPIALAPAPGVPRAAPPPAAPAPMSPVPAVPGLPGQPNLLVRSVLGLRAFGRKDSAIPAVAGAAPTPAGAKDSMLGLQQRRASPSAPPQALGGGYGGLPALPEPGPGGLSSGGLGSLPPRRDHGSSGGAPAFELPSLQGGADRGDYRRPHQRTPAPLSSTPPRGRSRAGSGRLRQREGQGESRWWIGALAALGVCAVVLGIVLVAVMITRRSNDPVAAGPTASGAVPSDSSAPSGAVAAGAVGSSLPRSRLLNDDERFKSLLSQVHGRGGKESAELRALFDEQAAIAAQALQPGCVGPQCSALKEIGKLVTNTTKRRVKRRSHSPDALRSRWLAGLDMPEIPVEDDPRVQKRFEFYTENPLGRETFQQMLFRCGAYKDNIQATLIRRGMPKDLIAVAYAESGCYPLAKSPVGAEGLWQFIPDAARAYHLRIIENIVDERHSPQKATEAAIQYFSDMYAKFGEWDLVFSAYNMGPFGLATRIEQVEGEKVGFWELVDAEMLPGETADYAPAIQAIALILNNLQKLKFGAIQQRAPQMTMDLPVPPNTRLSLVARAAALSVDELRRLNLDLKAGMTPAVPNFAVQVPKDSVWQARDTLAELLKTKDESDQCAPQNFDWGRQRFTPEMQEACTRTLGVRAAASAAAAAAPAPQ